MKKDILLSIFVLLIVQEFVVAQPQCITGDCQHGFSIIQYENGEKYIGHFRHGERSGQGVHFYADGTRYVGTWKKNQRHGEGRMYASHAGLNIKEGGIWQHDALVKVMDHKNKCVAGDCQNGYGIFLYANGTKYMGSFKDGVSTEQAVCFYPNGAKYIGDWKNHKMNGNGTLYHIDGTIDPGLWQDDKKMGDPKSIKGCVAGNCKDGKGVYIYQNNTKYDGDFQNTMAHGYGTCYYADGDQYVGEWKHHNFDGKGTMYYSDGTVLKGVWRAGEFIGETEAASKNIPQQRVTPKVWAILVGVARYNHMKSLKYTDDDAYRMYAFLRSPEGGALPDNQIRILIDEDATKEKITETLKTTFAKVGENDVVFFYFSGHGLKGAFLPIDFDGSGNKVEHSDILRLLNECKAKSKVVIADACHSGSLQALKGGNVQNVIESYYQAFSNSTGGTVLMMSSKAEETSIENNGLRQGIFSHFLIRGLKGAADHDNDKIITIGELFEYVQANVKFYTNNYQTPVINGEFDNNMPLGVVR